MAARRTGEIRADESDGYVVPAFRVPEERMAVLSAAMEEVIAANPDTRPEQLPNIHITNRAGTDLKVHPAFLDIALDEALLDLVSCVLGDDIVMWGCQIFCKPGSDGMEVPMHQDGQYWPIRPLATCTVWLAIDDSDRENGCLITVIPGSHRDRVHFRHRTRTDDNIVLNQAVDDRRAFVRPPASSSSAGNCPYTTSFSSTARRRTPPGTAGRASRSGTCRPLRGSGATSRCSSRGIPPTSRTDQSGSPADGMSAAGTTSRSGTPPRNRIAPRSPHNHRAPGPALLGIFNRAHSSPVARQVGLAQRNPTWKYFARFSNSPSPAVTSPSIPRAR